MNIIVAIITGKLQDADNNSYDRVIIVYVALAAMSVVVSLSLIVISYLSIDLRALQWTRKQRMARGDLLNERRERAQGEQRRWNRVVSGGLFAGYAALVLGSWAAYMWGAATGNNYDD